MDVRCEKCQTEYELDEARLKPGGVTVKCTNCGHMFKIRKRAATNVGAAPADARRVPGDAGDDAPTRSIIADDVTVAERQWIIRLENGEQKSCRELATLQQWIVANVVSRDALISRTGKTWKRLGDIAELKQYFEVADEARTTRAGRVTKPTTPHPSPAGAAGQAQTMLGIGAPPPGAGPAATGGTILPDDEAPTGRRPATQPPPPPAKPARTPPLGSNVATPVPQAKRASTPPPAPPPTTRTPTGPVPTSARPPTGPVPTVPARPPTPAPPVAAAAAKPNVPSSGERSTGVWAQDPTIKPTVDQGGARASGPFHGKLAAIPDEPAFAGRVRVAPSDERSFDTGRVTVEDDDDVLPARRGSRAGLLIVALMLLVGAGAAAVVYVFVLKGDGEPQAAATTDAAAVAVAPDAAEAGAPAIDAAEAPTPSPLDAARGELAANQEGRLKAALEALPKDDPAAQAVRANLAASLAQAMLDRASLVADKAEADKLRKDAKAIVLDAGTAAQRAHKAAPDDAGANLAMANVLRLQGKSAKDVRRYLDAAQAAATTDAGAPWARDVALAQALVLARDGKLDDAKAALTALDQGDGKLETSGDVRARFHLALIALAQNRAADAKPLVEQVLAAQPEHAGARALVARLETAVASTDPLPPEDPVEKPSTGGTKVTSPAVDTSGSYDQLLARANKLAETNCTKASELFAKALEQKPNGVEALTGQGYCHIDAKQFASAFSKFRAALAVSSRYEPALWGIGAAYLQQGRREQALEAFQKYLEAYPDSAKAKKQIERLGGGEPPPGGTPSEEPPKPTAPEPTPTPAPEPPPPPAPTPTEGTGSGAG